MKFKLGTVVAALGFMAATQSQANVLSPTSDVNNTGGSELVFTVFNSADNTSYSRDLGVTFNQLLGGATLPDFTADGLLGGINLSDPNVQWNVIAADGVVAGPTLAEYGARVLSTSTFQPAITNNDLEGSTTSATTWVNGLNILNSHDTVADGASLTQQLADSGNWVGGMNTLWKVNASGAVGSSMDFWLGTESLTETTGRGGVPVISAAPSDPAMFARLGTFTLAGDGTLSYSASAVPVPAAIWLFGSGVVGLTTVARRRRAKSA